MDFVTTLPIWALALLIFALRIADVTLGTVRTVAIVKGYLTLSMLLGFFEVGIWIIAVSQVITRLQESWLLILGYSGGFAAGNGVGIFVERRLALGTVVIRLVSDTAGMSIATAMRAKGFGATTFDGEGRNGPVTMVYATCARREVPTIVAIAKDLDAGVFYTIEAAQESNRRIYQPTHVGPSPRSWVTALKVK